MKYSILAVITLFLACNSENSNHNEWQSLFNGEDLSEWTINENPETFSVKDRMIIANGNRSHLFYSGPVNNADFKNFEFKAKVKATDRSNSGIFIHTKFQEEGWPSQGYEAQVSNRPQLGGPEDYVELKRTGSLYAIRNAYKQVAPDNEWMDYYIKVLGKNVQIKINGIETVNYTEPKVPNRGKNNSTQVLSNGTFALQGHDPGSTVMYKDIFVKVLDDSESIAPSLEEQEPVVKEIMSIQAKQFPFIDLHIIEVSTLNINELIENSFQTGINAGIVLPLDFESLTDDALRNHMSKYENYPVFKGIKVNIIKEGADYDLVDYVVFENLPELYTDDQNNYMDQSIADAISNMNSGKIKVYSGITRLPSEVESLASELWTESRMMDLINAAKANNVAIEIDNEAKMPSIDFIKTAKENGLMFTYANLGLVNGDTNIDYVQTVIEECKLSYKDFYIPN